LSLPDGTDNYGMVKVLVPAAWAVSSANKRTTIPELQTGHGKELLNISSVAIENVSRQPGSRRAGHWKLFASAEENSRQRRHPVMTGGQNLRDRAAISN